VRAPGLANATANAPSATRGEPLEAIVLREIDVFIETLATPSTS
jgi:hypothetical protein